MRFGLMNFQSAVHKSCSFAKRKSLAVNWVVNWWAGGGSQTRLGTDQIGPKISRSSMLLPTFGRMVIGS
jgi:hypothetical protein